MLEINNDSLYNSMSYIGLVIDYIYSYGMIQLVIFLQSDVITFDSNNLP
jgi:hypothetical protein